MRAWWFACVAAAVAFTSGRVALAEGASHPRVEVLLLGCEPIDQAEVTRRVLLELGALRPTNDPAEPSTQVEALCTQTRTRIRVHDAITRKRTERSVDLDEVNADARARLLAVALAELVFASWAELAVNPAPQSIPVGPRPPDSAVLAVRARVEELSDRRSAARPWTPASDLRPPLPPPTGRLRMLAVATGRWFLDFPGQLTGGGLSIADDPFRIAGWSADMLLEHGSLGTSLGPVHFDAITLGGSLVLHKEVGPVGFRAGAGIRIGLAALRGEPDTSVLGERRLLTPWGWPVAVAGINLAPIRPLAIELGAETGYVILPLSGLGGTGRETTLEGGWLSGKLAIGVFL